MYMVLLLQPLGGTIQKRRAELSLRMKLWRYIISLIGSSFIIAAALGPPARCPAGLID